MRTWRRAAGRDFQQHTQVTHGHRVPGQSQIFIATAALSDLSFGESLPVPARILVREGRVFAIPILHLIAHGIRHSPGDTHRVHRRLRSEIDDQPLWMAAVVLTSEAAVQIGIALPEGVEIAVGQSRVTVVFGLVDGVSAARQTVAKRRQNRRAGLVVGSPVASRVLAVAPAATWIPVPGLDAQFGTQTIAEWTQAYRAHGTQVRRSVDGRRITARVPIDPGTKRNRGHKGVARSTGQVNGHPDRRLRSETG